MQAQPQNVINNAPVGNPLLDLEANFGPLELNLLERVETGLTRPDHELPEERQPAAESKSPDRYQSKKEVIFVTGWVNIKSVYDRYLWGFVSKIFIGVALVFSLLCNHQNLWPVAAVFCAVNAIHTVKNLFFIFYYRRSTQSFKYMFWIELQMSLSYLIYFGAFLLMFLEHISNRFLPLAAMPLLILACFLFLTPSTENTYLAQKKFQIFESLQLFVIALKFSETGFVNWNYSLLFFMSASIYMTVLGMLLSIILSCSLFGFLYRNIEAWKIRALLWMTWYYLYSGMVYVYIIKGTVQLFHEEDFGEPVTSADFSRAPAQNSQVLVLTGVFLSLFSLVGLVLHLIWRKEIKRYLSKIIYREELQKEVSLRMLSDSFSFKLIRLSTTYFVRPTEDSQSKSIASDSTHATESELCEFCCTAEPDIVLEPCGHGGVCRECLVRHLTTSGPRCPWCKKHVKNVFIVNYCAANSAFMVKGEIEFKGQL